MKDTFEIINSSNNSIDLFNNSYFDTLEIIGLTELRRTLYSTTVPTVPGDFVNGSHDEGRDMTIVVRLKKNNIYTAETAIRYIFSVLTEEAMMLKWTKINSDGTSTVCSIPFYVEGANFERFERGVPGKINIHCTDAYFEGSQRKRYQLSSSTEYSATAVNGGDRAIGATITIYHSSDITEIAFANSRNSQVMRLRNIVNASNIIINTKRGEKSIFDYDGNNLMSCFDVTSDWLKIERGNNPITMTYTLPSGATLSGATITFYEVFV